MTDQIKSGGELAMLRQSAGMKAKDLAAALDISPEHLSRMEQGTKPVSRVMGLAIYTLLSRTPSHGRVSDEVSCVSPSGPGLRDFAPEPAAQSQPKALVPDVWQPIETAPRDENAIIVAWNGSDVTAANRYESGWCDFWYDWIDPQPTHWMPLPPAPPQGIEAGTAETQGGSVHESPVGEADAPDTASLTFSRGVDEKVRALLEAVQPFGVAVRESVPDDRVIETIAFAAGDYRALNRAIEALSTIEEPRG